MTRTTLPFHKMNGIGNAILVVDARLGDRAVTADAARTLARMPGLAFDQLMAIGPARQPGGDPFVTIWNADGTEAGACGNGTRCVAWALMRDGAETRMRVETAAGSLACERLGPMRFSVDMGPPSLGWAEIPLASHVEDTSAIAIDDVTDLPPEARCFAAVSMGNPHAVFFVRDIAGIDLQALGPAIERHPLFPARANVSFAQVLDRETILLRVWERSAGATLACGSAACATAVAGVRRGLTERRVRVTLPGGTLEIEWRAADGHVVMAGDVELEQSGTLPTDLPGLDG